VGVPVSGLVEPSDPAVALLDVALDGDEARTASIMGATGPEAQSLPVRLALADATCVAELNTALVNQPQN